MTLQFDIKYKGLPVTIKSKETKVRDYSESAGLLSVIKCNDTLLCFELDMELQPNLPTF